VKILPGEMCALFSLCTSKSNINQKELLLDQIIDSNALGRYIWYPRWYQTHGTHGNWTVL